MAPGAFVATLVGTVIGQYVTAEQVEQEMTSAADNYNQLVHQEHHMVLRDVLDQTVIVPRTQAQLNDKVHRQDYDKLVLIMETEYQSKARILDMTGKSTSLWMDPSFTSKGLLRMSSFQFSIILRRALGVQFLTPVQKAEKRTCPTRYTTTHRRCVG